MKTTAIILFFASAFLNHTHAAEITAIGKYCSGPCAYLEGEIKSGDLIKLKAIFESPTRQRLFIPDWKPPTELFLLQLNSRGGELAEAMEIGRWIRKNRIGAAVVDQMECFSSCVYLLAAGIGKYVVLYEGLPNGLPNAEKLSAKIGIHRPYLTQLPREGVQVAMRKALVDSRVYFAEMNIPEQLADEMFSIPPDKMEILTESKLSYYRLNSYDMAWEEEVQLRLAARFGMTRQQYMEKSKLRDDEWQACLEGVRGNAERERRGVEKFDGQKCIQDVSKKYGLHESQRKQSR